MLITSAGSRILIAGQTIGHPGRFVDNFQRETSIKHAPLGMGWQDLGLLLPTTYDITRINDGNIVSGDPLWRGKNGANMIPDPDNWGDYGNYPGQVMGGIGGAIRNVGDGIYNYDVTCTVGGLLYGHDSGNSHAEGTPLVGVNTSTDKLGYGCWITNLGTYPSNIFVLFVGYLGNPPESFNVTHVGSITHTLGQQREVTLKYRATGYTLWIDGSQVTTLSSYPGGVPLGSDPLPLHADHQNRSWAGFAYDYHLNIFDEITTTPSVLSYEHQVIN